MICKQKRIHILAMILSSIFFCTYFSVTTIADTGHDIRALSLNQQSAENSAGDLIYTNLNHYIEVDKSSSISVTAPSPITYTILVTNYAPTFDSNYDGTDGDPTVFDLRITDVIPSNLGGPICTASYYDAGVAPVSLGTITEVDLINCVDAGDMSTPRDPFDCSTGNGVDGTYNSSGSIVCQVSLSSLTNGIIISSDINVNFQIANSSSWETEFNILFDSDPIGNQSGYSFGGFGNESNLGAGTIIYGSSIGITDNLGAHSGSASSLMNVYIYESFDDPSDFPDSCLVDFSLEIYGFPYVTEVTATNTLVIPDVAFASSVDNTDLSPTLVSCVGIPDWDTLCSSGS